MGMAVDVRQAVADDVEPILEIWRKCGLSPWPRKDIEREIGRKGSIFIVSSGESIEGICGFIIGRVVPAAEREFGLDAEIYNIGVSPESRSCGIGSTLLNEFVIQCLKAGVSAIWLEVRASNDTAIKFYRKHGFIDAGTRKNFYRDPVEDALLMRSHPSSFCNIYLTGS